MFEPIYSLQLAGGDMTVKSDSSGFGVFPLSFGTGYADQFRRDRAPSQMELLGHLVGTAYRCANLNAHLVAGSRLRLYARKDRKSGKLKGKYFEAAAAFGKVVTQRVPRQRVKALRECGAMGKSALLDATDRGDDIDEVIDHPLLDLLHNPENAFDDGGLAPYSHRYVTQLLLETIGRAYWLIEDLGLTRTQGKVKLKKMLRMLRAQLVMERPDLAGMKYIDHYDYGSARLDPQDVVRMAYPDPSNPHLGFHSPMRAAVEKVRLLRGGDAFMGALLQNGGYPAGILSPKDGEGVIGAPEAKRIESSMRGQTSMHNAGRLLVLGSSSVELQTLAFKPAEIIDVKRAQELEGEIADCFDVPRTKLFRDSSNRASSESGDMAHAKDAGLPRCSMLEEAWNVQLVPLFDQTGTLFLAFDSPVPQDRIQQMDETRTGGQLGLTTIDEGRGALGLDPVEGEIGSLRVLPKGTVLLKEDGTPVDTGGDEPDDDEQPKPKPKKPKKSKMDRLIWRMVKNTQRQAEAMSRLAERLEQVEHERIGRSGRGIGASGSRVGGAGGIADSAAGYDEL